MCDCPSIRRIGISSANCTHQVLEHIGNSWYKCMQCDKLIDKWTLKRFNPCPCYDCEYKKIAERSTDGGSESGDEGASQSGGCEGCDV